MLGRSSTLQRWATFGSSALCIPTLPDTVVLDWSCPPESRQERRMNSSSSRRKKKRQLCGSLWEMGRDDKSSFEEKSSIMFTEGRFFNSCCSADPTFHRGTCYFNKRQPAHKEILSETLPIQISALHYPNAQIKASIPISLCFGMSFLQNQTDEFNMISPRLKEAAGSCSENMHGLEKIICGGPFKKEKKKSNKQCWYVCNHRSLDNYYDDERP